MSKATIPPLDVKFTLVTPAFAGAAEKAKTDGLRIPALKALLRFWWRTRYPELSRGELFARESAIFGSTEAHRLRFRPVSKVTPDPKDPKQVRTGPAPSDSTLSYMAYGPVTRPEGAPTPQFNTPQLQPGIFLETHLLWHRNGTTSPRDARPELLCALWLFSAFGGYGGRSRRGWGSLRITGVEKEWESLGLRDPHSGEDAASTAGILLSGLRTILRSPVGTATWSAVNHTAFSADARLLVLDRAEPTWKAALDRAKKDFEIYRRALGAWYYHHQNGVGVGPDHDLRSTWLKRAPTPGAPMPQGSAFGLPHNGRFSIELPNGNRAPRGDKFEVGVGEDLSGRRASPVFFKLLQCTKGVVPVVLFLPAVFVTSNDIYERHQNRGVLTQPVNLSFRDYTAITDFFDGRWSLVCYEPNGTGCHWYGLRGLGWSQVDFT